MSALDWLAAMAPYLIIAAVFLLFGAALGYYTASKDLENEKAKVWKEAYTAGVDDEAEANAEGVPAFPRPNPYKSKESSK